MLTGIAPDVLIDHWTIQELSRFTTSISFYNQNILQSKTLIAIFEGLLNNNITNQNTFNRCPYIDQCPEFMSMYKQRSPEIG